MGILEILIGALLIGLMYYLVLRYNHSQANGLNDKVLKDSGIDTSNYKTIIDSTKQIVHDANQRRSQEP